MFLTVTIWSALITIAFGACGHYQGIPVDTCTEITNSNGIQQSFIYTCISTDEKDEFSKWEFDNADCSGNSTGIQQGFRSQCGKKTSNFYIPSKCTCDEVTECEIATTRTLIGCDETQYTQESYIMNECVGQSSIASTVRVCGEDIDDPDNPVITYNFDNVDCSCANEMLEEDDVKCQIQQTGSNELCPRYFQTPIGECISEEWSSFKYTCEDDGNGGYTFNKVEYWTTTCEESSASTPEDVTAYCSADENNCYCGENGNVASMENCNTAKLTDVVSCDGTTVNETVIINQCVPSNLQSNTYHIYACDDDGISSVETYYDETCTQTSQSPSVAPTRGDFIVDGCTQLRTIDCEYNTVTDDSECGHLDQYPVNQCFKNLQASAATGGDPESYMYTCMMNQTDGSYSYYYNEYDGFDCSGDPYLTADRSWTCEENGGSSTCNCASDASNCNLAFDEYCGTVDLYEKDTYVIDKCIYDTSGSGKYKVLGCDSTYGIYAANYYNDDQCTEIYTEEPTPPPTGLCVTTTIEPESSTCTPSPTTAQPSGSPTTEQPSGSPTTEQPTESKESSESTNEPNFCVQYQYILATMLSLASLSFVV